MVVDDNKIIDIETRLAHQEVTLQELNDAMSSQQAQIMDLERLCKTLIDRVRALSEGDINSGEEKPPHY